MNLCVCFPRGAVNVKIFSLKMSNSERLNPNNPIVFFDVTVGSTVCDRMRPSPSAVDYYLLSEIGDVRSTSPFSV